MPKRKLTYEEFRDKYIKQNTYPPRPKRVWVSVLKGKPTRAGAEWICATVKWEADFLFALIKYLGIKRIRKQRDEEKETKSLQISKNNWFCCFTQDTHRLLIWMTVTNTKYSVSIICPPPPSGYHFISVSSIHGKVHYYNGVSTSTVP